jgi:hypothetical protein
MCGKDSRFEYSGGRQRERVRYDMSRADHVHQHVTELEASGVISARRHASDAGCRAAQQQNRKIAKRVDAKTRNSEVAKSQV